MEQEKLVVNRQVRVGRVKERKYVPPLEVVTVPEVAGGADIPDSAYVTKAMSTMTRVQPEALELRFFDRQRLKKIGGPYGIRAMRVLFSAVSNPFLIILKHTMLLSGS